MDEEYDECYGCNISEEDEELNECEDCGQLCCDSCLGGNCACDFEGPEDPL
jgi:hypothetical protein